MKTKTLPIIIGSLCLLNVANLAFAEDYYSVSNQGPSVYQGPSTPQTPSIPQGPSVHYPNGDHHRDVSYDTRHHHRDEHKSVSKGGITISVNTPGYNNYIVNKHDHHIAPPPHIHQARLRGPTWIDMAPGAPIPAGAIAGGAEHHQTLYVCRGHFRGGVHPGKMLSGRCHISWGGQEIALSHYQILASDSPLNWVSANYGDIPPYAISGGQEHGDTLYICQARYHGGIHTGKVIGQGCNIAWGGREIALPHYSILAG